MRKWITTTALLLCMGILQCGGDDTELNISITSHPTGGADVTLLTCVFEGELIGGTTPIEATVEWWWEDGFHENDEVVFSDSWTFDEEDAEEVSTFISAPAGFIFLNYYWVRITWTDEDGTDNELESNKAYCTSSKSYDTSGDLFLKERPE